MTFKKIQKDLVCPNTGSDLLIIKILKKILFKSSKNKNLKYILLTILQIINRITHYLIEKISSQLRRPKIK